MNPADIVSLLNPTTPDLAARIGCMTKSWEDATTKVSGRFFYVQFKDSKPTVDDLIAIAHARMVNFAIPRTRIDEVLASVPSVNNAADAWIMLATEARDLFIKTKKETGRSGELGEILLYMLLEWALKAPLAACKMYLKTAQQMPIHGTDGVHLGHNGKHLVMYWGESKMHASLAQALSDIATSVAKHVDTPERYQNEVRIVRANINLADGPAREALKNYFNPYKGDSNKVMDCYACLAGFDSDIYDEVAALDHELCEAEFCRRYQDRIDSACELILTKVKDAGLSDFRFSFFLLPFPSVDVAREKFQRKLWGA